jgi:hypothetical protein
VRDREPTVIPQGFIVERLPAKVAQGAYKPKLAGRGDAPTFGHAATSTQRVFAAADRRTIRNLAARGW